MAITVVRNNGGWEVTFDNSTEWDITSATLNGSDSLERSKGVKLRSLEVIPTATDDAIKIRDGGATGRVIMNVVAADARDERIKYFNTDPAKYYKLYVVASEVSSGVKLLIDI